MGEITAQTGEPAPLAPSAEADLAKRNGVGVALLCAGIFAFSLQDVAIKQLSGQYSVFQIVFVRSLVALPLVLVIWLARSRESSLGTTRPALHAVRVALMFVSYTSYYLALAAMPLAAVVAIAFSTPMIILIASVLVFGDPVGPRRWFAVAVGFAGVLVILRPGADAFEPAALFAVLSAFCYGAGAMLARTLGQTDSGAKMAFYATLGYLAASSVGVALAPLLGGGDHPSIAFAAMPWREPELPDLVVMAGVGAISAFGFYFLAEAYRVGQSSAVAPFEYSGVIWAVAWGLLFFHETPDTPTMVGIVMIVGAGLFIIHRERVRREPLLTRRGRLRMRSGL